MKAALSRAGRSAAFPMAATALLCIVHLAILTGTPLLQYLVLDLESYDRWARRIAAGDWLGSGVFYQDPLYAYAMGLVYALTGARVVHVLLVQVGLTSLTVLLVHGLADRVFSRASAIVASWAMALYAPAIYYAAKPEKACLSALALTAALWTLARTAGRAPLPASSRTSLWGFAGAGALFGLTALLRANVLLLAAIVIVLLVATDMIVRTGRARASCAFAAGLAAVLLPVLARNAVVGHDLVLTTSQLGANLYIGNHPGNLDGSYTPPPFIRASPRYEQEDFARHAELVAGRSLRPSQVSRFYVRQVAAWALHEPIAFIRLQALKLRAFVNAYEIGDSWSLDFVRQYSPILNLPLLGFGVVFPLAVLGAALALARREARWLVVLTVSYAGTVVGFYVFSRYRYPIVPALIVLAAWASVELARFVRQRAWRALGAALVVLVAILVHTPPTVDARADLSHRFYNLAAPLYEAGRIDESESLCRRALAIDPGNGFAWFTLSRIAAKRGDASLEDTYLARAQQLRPLDLEILARRIKRLTERGAYDEAESILLRLIAQGNEDARHWQMLSNVHYLAGEREKARSDLIRALALEPGNPLLLRNLEALGSTVP